MKNFLKSGLFILIIICMDFGFRFLMEPVTYFGHYAESDYRNNMGKYDTVFLGSSWTFQDYNVSEYDRIMGDTYTFNAGTVGQIPIDSYYYLKQIIEDNPVKKVYFNISPNRFTYVKNNTSSVVLNDRLRGWNKIKHMLAASNKDLILYYSGIYRYKKDLSPSAVIKNLRIKSTREYRDGSLRFDENPYYTENGYVGSAVKMNRHNNDAYTPGDGFGVWDTAVIQKYDEDYFFRILDICEKNQIELVLLVPPSSIGYLQTIKGYDEFHNYVQKIANEHKMRFLDFNYLNPSPFSDDELFQDYNHLNSEGAKILTPLLCKVLYDRGSIDPPAFCRSLSERKDLAEICGGVMGEVKKAGQLYLVNAKPSGPKGRKLFYRYSAQYAGSDSWNSVTDFAENNLFMIRSQSGLQRIKIECCPEGTPSEEAAYTIKAVSEAVTDDTPNLYAAYLRTEESLYLAVTGVRDRKLRFSQWVAENSYELIKDDSDQDLICIKLPPYGMYRYKVEYLDPVSGEVTDQAEAFINLEDGWV